MFLVEPVLTEEALYHAARHFVGRRTATIAIAVEKVLVVAVELVEIILLVVERATHRELPVAAVTAEAVAVVHFKNVVSRVTVLHARQTEARLNCHRADCYRLDKLLEFRPSCGLCLCRFGCTCIWRVRGVGRVYLCSRCRHSSLVFELLLVASEAAVDLLVDVAAGIGADSCAL